MRALTSQELLSPADYEQQRQTIRQRVIDLKKRRRLAVGELVTLIFENRETVRFQIQEMIRAERIFDADKIQEELNVYNDLLPKADELSATLFIEITDSARIQELLDAFQGIDQPDTLRIEVGDACSTATFEAGHSKEDKISAVHFVRFKTTPAFRAQLSNNSSPASLIIDHSHYQRRAEVPWDLRQEWIKDLDEVSA